MRAHVAWIAVLSACTEYGYKAEDPECVDRPVQYRPEATPDCHVDPQIGAFDPIVEWMWRDNPIHPGVHQVDSQPVVANLTDDDGDGDADRDDIPDVVFNAFAQFDSRVPGATVAVSGTGETLWSVTSPGGAVVSPFSGVAVGDLEGDGFPEVVVSGWQGLVCLDHTGALKWKVEIQSGEMAMPAIGDLEGDGLAEVVLGRTVVDHDGVVRWFAPGGMGQGLSSYPVDLDGDGFQEIVAGNTVYGFDGAIRTELDIGDGWTAHADFDLDGVPELVTVTPGVVSLFDLEGHPRWRTPTGDSGGGAPTIADYDGDGFPEVGVAGRERYTVIDTDGTPAWNQPISDYSSSVTGSSVFDFEGDGAAEVVYADEHTLWVYDGATGTIELQWDAHSSGTLFEYPVIVDIDRDGSAEIVVASNDFRHGESHGITVIGDSTSSWSPARPIWNQHAYYITNIDDDGRVPVGLPPNWVRFNSFRAGNSETAVGYARPDVAIGEPDVCLWECWEDHALVSIPVENRGEVPVHDLQIAIGSRVETIGTVLPGEMHWVGPIELRAEDFGDDGLVVRADQGDDWPECDETNNSWTIEAYPCE